MTKWNEVVIRLPSCKQYIAFSEIYNHTDKATSYPHVVIQPNSFLRLNIFFVEMEEVVVGEPRRVPVPPPPRFMFRVMNIPILRKAPWLMYLFLLCVAVGLAVMGVRLQLGDDLLPIICAAVTVGLIFATGLCVYFSVKNDGSDEQQKPKKIKKTVLLKAHSFIENHEGCEPTTCHICLTDFEKGEKVVDLECGHLFHVECATNWVKRVPQCPACRYSLPVQVRSSTSSPGPLTANQEQV
jgi:hypothetical protein